MAKLADAGGLTPPFPSGKCGFESRPGHLYAGVCWCFVVRLVDARQAKPNSCTDPAQDVVLPHGQRVRSRVRRSVGAQDRSRPRPATGKRRQGPSVRRGTDRSTTCSLTNSASRYTPTRSRDRSDAASQRPTCHRSGSTISATPTRRLLSRPASIRRSFPSGWVTPRLASPSICTHTSRLRSPETPPMSWRHESSEIDGRAAALSTRDRSSRSIAATGGVVRLDKLGMAARPSKYRSAPVFIVGNRRSAVACSAQENPGEATSCSSSWRSTTTRRPNRRAGISPRRTDAYAVVREMPRMLAVSSTVRVARSGGSRKLLMSAPSSDQLTRPHTRQTCEHTPAPV